MIKDVRFNHPGSLFQEQGHRGLVVSTESVREAKTASAAGRSRSLWFLKGTLNLAFVLRHSPP